MIGLPSHGFVPTHAKPVQILINLLFPVIARSVVVDVVNA